MYKIHAVYVISDGQYIKIGISTNVSRRLATLQGSNARPLMLVGHYRVPQWKKCKYPGCITCAKNYERKIHKEFKNYRVSGEWFMGAATVFVMSFIETEFCFKGSRLAPLNPAADVLRGNQCN